jgi:hypothetical protein
MASNNSTINGIELEKNLYKRIDSYRVYISKLENLIEISKNNIDRAVIEIQNKCSHQMKKDKMCYEPCSTVYKCTICGYIN